MLKQRHQIFVGLLCLMDATVVLAACYASWLARRLRVEGGLPEWGVAYWREALIPIAVPIALCSIWLFGLYRPWRDRSLASEIKQVLKASLSAAVALLVVLWLGGAEWSEGDGGVTGRAVRMQLLVFAGLLPLALGAHRWGFRLSLRAIRRRGWNLRHVAVIGTGRLGRIACRTLDRNSWTGIHVDYFISHLDTAAPGSECAGRKVLGGLADIETVFEESKPDAVYIAMPNSRAAEVPGVLKRLERYVVDVRIIPDVHPRYMPQNMSVSELEGMPILSVRESPLYGLGGAVKRVLDVVGALGAIAVFSPLMGAIALVIRVTSPGPVIFKQRRVGLGGEGFNIYKFRTMYEAEDEQGPARWTSREDPRITPVGRWLRRTSLDELPQLFNVVKGEMSLVGPRPERPELIERFRDDWRGYMLRQHVKAGITGWAQVNGLRGDTSLRKRLQLDLFYIRHWSIWFDVKILWLTVFRGFVHRNAH